MGEDAAAQFKGLSHTNVDVADEHAKHNLCHKSAPKSPVRASGPNPFSCTGVLSINPALLVRSTVLLIDGQHSLYPAHGQQKSETKEDTTHSNRVAWSSNRNEL